MSGKQTHALGGPRSKAGTRQDEDCGGRVPESGSAGKSASRTVSPGTAGHWAA